MLAKQSNVVMVLGASYLRSRKRFNFKKRNKLQTKKGCQMHTKDKNISVEIGKPDFSVEGNQFSPLKKKETIIS